MIPPNSVMVDIETTGPSPTEHVMFQIGACYFDKDFNVTKTFRASLTPPPDRTDCAETLEWWRKENWPLYTRLRAEARPFEAVLEEFRLWLPPRPYLWAWPAHMDLLFLFHYARKWNRRLLYPIYPSRFIDCRSWAYGQAGRRLTLTDIDNISYAPNPLGGTLHDGLDDAVWQVDCLRRIADLYRSRHESQ